MLPINKIICGDALDTLKLLPDESVHLAITSPPYNLDKPYSNHNDLMIYNEYLDWMGEIWEETKRVLVKGGRLCINIGENKRQNITYPTYSAFIQQCVDLKMLYRGTLIWNKHSAAKHCAWGSWNSCTNPHIVPRHEYIIVFSKGQWKLEGSSKSCDLDKEEFMKYSRSIWVFAPESRKKIGHPAPFPKELPYRLIKFYSYQGNIVLDMFAGSGTVGLVAKKLDRNFILIDNSMEYCKLASERLNRELQPTLSDKTVLKIEIINYEQLKSEMQKVSPLVVAEKRTRYTTSEKKRQALLKYRRKK